VTKRRNGEGNYFQRPDGTWTYRTVKGGRRYSGTGPTMAKAKAKADERAKIAAPKGARDTFGELLKAWEAAPLSDLGEKGLRGTTRDNYRSLVRAHILPRLRDVLLSRLTAAQVSEVLERCGGAVSTRRSTYAGLVSVLDYGVQTQRIGTNVARDVKRPSATKAASRELDDKGARKLLKAASGHRLEVGAWLLLGCGLRRGEALALRWRDVDLEGGSAYVSGNVTRSSAGLVRGETKTERGERRVPLSPPVVEALKAHRATQAADRLRLGPAWQDSGLVLTNAVGGTLEPRAFSRAWAGWARTAGLKDRGTHLARHYAATVLLASGHASVVDVAAQLGHDPAMLLRVYASAVAAGQRAAASALGATLTASDDEADAVGSVPTLVPTAAVQGGI
jgi:integrase